MEIVGELVHNSDLIVVAAVSDQSQFSPVAVSTALTVEKAIKGTLPEEPVTVFQLGALGDAGILQKGMRYVLFLGKQTDSEPNTFFVKGGHEGIFFASAGTLHGPEKFVGDLQPKAGSDPLEALEQAVQTIMALQPA